MTEQSPTPNDAASATQSAPTPDLTQEVARLKDEIAAVRSEAAKYRVEKKDAVEAVKADLTTEYDKKVQDLTDELAATSSTITKLKIALESEIPHDKVESFAGLLKGNDEAELRSHAEELTELFSVSDSDSAPKKTPAVDPSQGSGTKEIPLNGDPLLNALKSAVGIAK